MLKRLDLKKIIAEIAEIKDIVKRPLLNKKEKIKKIEKIIKIKRYDAYKPVKDYEAFDGNFIEYQNNGDRDKSISTARYLRIIRGYLKKMVDSKKKSGEWKIQLIMKINFISSRNFIESRDMYSKSDSFEIMMGANTNEIIKNLFNSLLRRYQGGLQESMRGSDFVFYYVESLHYIFHKIDMKRSGSYIETPDWIKKKKATINVENDDDKCFQYSVTVALNYDEIGNHHPRVNKVRSFMDQYNWKDISFPSHVGDWKKFELNNRSIALNVLYVPEGEKTIRHAYKSKSNLTRENQVILIMISDGEKWHYLTVRSLSALVKGITSKHKGDSHCLNCFHWYRTKEALEKHMKVSEDKDYCYIEMPKKGETLKYHPVVKSMKAPYIIVADIESLLRK